MAGEWFGSPTSDESDWSEVRLSRVRPLNRQQLLRVNTHALRGHGQVEASNGLCRVFVSMLPTSGDGGAVKLALRADRQS